MQAFFKSIKGKLLLFSFFIFLIPSLIISVISYMTAKQGMDELGETVIKNSVETALQLIESINYQVEQGAITIQEAQERVKSQLIGERGDGGQRSLTYPANLGENGYIYILGLGGTLLGHPTLEGDNLWENQDGSGKYFIREVQEQALAGGGFTYYDFELPGQTVVAPKLIYSKLDPHWNWIIASGTYMQDFNSPVSALMKTIAWTLVLSAIVSGVIAIIFSRHLAIPLTLLSKKVEEMATGDLTVVINLEKREDEIGKLTTGFNHMVVQLKALVMNVEKTMTEIQGTSSSLLAVAEETTAVGENIVQVIGEVATGASQQALDTEQTNCSMAHFAKQIDVLEEKNHSMQLASTQMQGTNEQGLRDVQHLQLSAESSNERMIKMQEIFHNLLKKMSQIEGIVGTIDEISEQTNLLALNASIEAARAGEHGKGFAVVAEEVRKLADQTQRATASVQETLKGIETETSIVTNEMEKAVQFVQNQRESVSDTRGSFEAIAQSVIYITTAIQDMADSVGQLNSAKNTMMDSIDSIAGISEKNAAVTQEVTASVEEQQQAIQLVTNSSNELTNEITSLQEVIQQFKVR